MADFTVSVPLLIRLHENLVQHPSDNISIKREKLFKWLRYSINDYGWTTQQGRGREGLARPSPPVIGKEKFRLNRFYASVFKYFLHLQVKKRNNINILKIKQNMELNSYIYVCVYVYVLYSALSK